MLIIRRVFYSNALKIIISILSKIKHKKYIKKDPLNKFTRNTQNKNANNKKKSYTIEKKKPEFLSRHCHRRGIEETEKERERERERDSTAASP